MKKVRAAPGVKTERFLSIFGRFWRHFGAKMIQKSIKNVIDFQGEKREAKKTQKIEKRGYGTAAGTGRPALPEPRGSLGGR